MTAAAAGRKTMAVSRPVNICSLRPPDEMGRERHDDAEEDSCSVCLNLAVLKMRQPAPGVSRPDRDTVVEAVDPVAIDPLDGPVEPPVEQAAHYDPLVELVEVVLANQHCVDRPQ